MFLNFGPEETEKEASPGESQAGAEAEHPVARSGHAMVYDEVSKRVLLFGGAFAMLASVLFLQGILSYLFFTMGFISSIASFYLLNAMNKIGGSL